MKMIALQNKIREVVVRSLILLILVIPLIPSHPVRADEAQIDVIGKVYEFDEEKDYYTFSKASHYVDSDKNVTCGQFSIAGKSTEITLTKKRDGVPSYTVPEGSIEIFYTYDDSLLNAPETEWHLVEDKQRSIDSYKTETDINRGVMVLQRSLDRLNWSDVSVSTDIFSSKPSQSEPIYETRDIELINGCYYRLIVAYELARHIETKKSFWIFDNPIYEYKRIAEVYEFYAKMNNSHIAELQSNENKYHLGAVSKATSFSTYDDGVAVGKGDLHYGWELGDFYVSGYTSKQTNDEGETVFLKNVGDVVTLWFDLKQNIDALNNQKDLAITADKEGQNTFFETPKMDFGRGMLIIRKVDNENVASELVMYSNFLEANTSFDADTRVQLFEEGDYAVELDYQVTKDQVVDKIEHYYIFFYFSVRNANSMVFLKDAKTGSELTNSAVTANGFRIDLANSKYLDLFIKKEIWTEGAEGLSTDTRFNTTAKDGSVYTDEGIYTITVKNRYTGLETEKRIYVGTNPILMAYMTTNYSLAEIQELVAKGAVIYEDGSIELPPETFTVTHQFVSGTKGMVLPSEVNNLLPTDQGGVLDGAEVYPGVVEESEVEVEGGTWVFQGWDTDKKTIEVGNQTFIGIWVFEEKQDNSTGVEIEEDSEMESEAGDEGSSNSRLNEGAASEVELDNNSETMESDTVELSESENELSDSDEGESESKKGVVLPIIAILGIGLAGSVSFIKTKRKKERL